MTSTATLLHQAAGFVESYKMWNVNHDYFTDFAVECCDSFIAELKERAALLAAQEAEA